MLIFGMQVAFYNTQLVRVISRSRSNIKVNSQKATPGWLSGELVGLMTWWLRVGSPVEATFLSGVFLPLTSAEAHEKSSRWLCEEKLC